LHPEFTLIFTTNFVGSLDIRASREVFPIEVRSPEIPFVFITINNNDLRGDNMAKSHYSFKKRKKEIERKLKQEEKRQRKLDKNSIKPEDELDEPQDEVKSLLN
jgi:hypothetical protein